MTTEPTSETPVDGYHYHPATEALLKYFVYDHLREGALRETSAFCHDLAYQMANSLPFGPELTTGLRKLLEAKDCFVRAALDVPSETYREGT